MASLFTRRNLLRLILLAVFAVAALGVLPGPWSRWRVALPGLSPLLSLGGALAARSAGALTLLGLPLLLLPLFKGRFFCWKLCPMGFVAETASRLNPRGTGLIRKVPFIGKALAPVMLGSAAAGWPLFIWTDPLCVFNGFFAAWHKPVSILSAATALGFVLIVLASVIAPNIWCHRLCPLGGLEEWLTQLGNRFRAPRPAAPPAAAAPASVGRRVFLGFAIGGLAGLAYGGVKRIVTRVVAVIRPPGAAAAFNALCARCGNCMRACPKGLIVPDLGASGIDGLFTPRVAFRSQNADQEKYCEADCHACTEVCPTRALVPLTNEEKQQTAIGLARLDKKLCIAWEKREYCVVCEEYCPYHAVSTEDKDGVKCPTVDAEKCRGCGACESNCPALPIAIVVEGRSPQVRLTAPSPQLEGNA
ncbi:MAG: 4Fe-4S binding protein [Verrucomicrobiota bacterium]|jgi:ferredoxin|nr:4Fe-4S binding protein [Verrucomicrobiota bacterium]